MEREESFLNREYGNLSQGAESFAINSALFRTESKSRHYPEAYNQLQSIAQKNGFERVLVTDDPMLTSSVEVKTEFGKKYVFFNDQYFFNHEKLLKEYDSELAEEGANLVLEHEDAHFDKKVVNFDEDFNRMFPMADDGAKLRKVATFGAGITLEEKASGWLEMQTDLGNFGKKFKDRDDFVKKVAIRRVYANFLQSGEKSLEGGQVFGPETAFIAKDVLEDIRKEEDKVRERALTKFREKHKDQAVAG